MSAINDVDNQRKATEGLARALVLSYTKESIVQMKQTIADKKETIGRRLSQQDLEFIGKIQGLVKNMDLHYPPSALDKALEIIDLESIYSGVDKRENENTDPNLKYDDFLVLELLHYFKNDFFEWVDVPKCTRCNTKDNIKPLGAQRINGNNPDLVSVIEKYVCSNCNGSIEFPRINNPAKLLETRKGRCGEWVNCFILILKAVLGSNASIRYVWNNEDHVWCEYYSLGLKRWVHLDPCEAAFDEPNLYCDNWKKKMSWVIGVNDSYMIDLSDKYITNKEVKLDKASVVTHPTLVSSYIKFLAYDRMNLYANVYIKPYKPSVTDQLFEFYHKCLLLYTQETMGSKDSFKTPKDFSVTGRQNASKEWVMSRGEGGA